MGEDGLVDVIGQGCDAGVRFAESLHLDAVAVSLGAPHRFRLVASPGYVARHGAPERPRDVVRHNCLAQIFPSGSRLPWEFERDGECETVVPQGTLATSEPSAQLVAAKTGLGLAYLFAEQCEAGLADGSLVPLLDDWLQAGPACRHRRQRTQRRFALGVACLSAGRERHIDGGHGLRSASSSLAVQ